MIVEMTMEQWQEVVAHLPEGWARDRINGFIQGRKLHDTYWVQVTASQPDGRSGTTTFLCRDYDDMLTMDDIGREAMSEYRLRTTRQVAEDA